jgi:hypothetical protein
MPAEERPFDIEIRAAASARRVRFREPPDTDIRFRGEPECDSTSETARENLPDRVESGVTYRDVRVEWRAGARLAER